MVEKLVSRPVVSFVLPAYNEAEFIEDVLERLESTANGRGLSYEVVVVDDGSVDDTRLRAIRYATRNGHVKVVGYKKNVGKGHAVKTGFWKAAGDAVVFVDSDSDVDVTQIRQYVDALKFGDIVVGSKWHSDSAVETPLIRKILSRGFNVLARLLTGVQVGDTQTGIKAVKRDVFVDVFKRLSVKRYAFDVELLVLAKLYDLKIVEFPVKLKLNGLFSLSEVWRMLLDLLGISYRLRIKKWYQRSLK